MYPEIRVAWSDIFPGMGSVKMMVWIAIIFLGAMMFVITFKFFFFRRNVS